MATHHLYTISLLILRYFKCILVQVAINLLRIPSLKNLPQVLVAKSWHLVDPIGLRKLFTDLRLTDSCRRR